MMYQIYTDSSISPYNPGGLLTWAFLVKFKKEIIHQATEIIGYGNGMTNNRGELAAVMMALQWLLTLPKKEQYPVLVNSDSQLAVNFSMGTWECRESTLKPIVELIHTAKHRYPRNVTVKWIPREQNTEADALSRSLYTEEALEILKVNRNNIMHDWDDIPF